MLIILRWFNADLPKYVSGETEKTLLQGFRF